ncbi:MAG: SIR2 family protein [bacterium]
MEKQEPNVLPLETADRPQIVLIGNGLERKNDEESGKDGTSWEELVDSLTVPNHIPFEKGELDSVPFPLQYHLLSSERDAPYPLRAGERSDEQKRLVEKVQELPAVTNPALRRLPELGAEHIFTTNYTYSLEKAFYPKKNMLNSKTRRALRFNYHEEQTEKGNQRLERQYRLHTGYLAKNSDGSPVHLWHIHGECAIAGSIILGHDGYGRLLSRIVSVCGNEKKYRALQKKRPYALTSWPELFLFGDVYILGLGMAISEFDLWWLLRRKQLEERGTGRVYFYTNDAGEKNRARDLMLNSLGVSLNPGGIEKTGDYDTFYARALVDIQARIAENRR